MEPSMEQTVACITTRGGKNDHTPIWCKEHGLPCAVSVKGAPEFLKDGNLITYYGVGDTPAFYEGRHQYSVTETQLEGLKPSPIPIRLIVSDASTARSVCMRSYFPSLNIGRGSGLVRWEMLAAKLRVHPMAVMNYSTLESDFLQLVGQGRMTKEEAVKTAESVAEFIRTESGELSPVDWYVKALAREIAGIVSPYYTDDINEPMVVRLPDFKTNEHADLLGGRAYEPVEENPMLGDRGAGKYLGAYQKAFLEIDLKALAYVINEMGYTNIHIEVPFVRTPDEMKAVAKLVKDSGIDIPLQMMFALPVNISRAADFFKVADGGQIGSNDLLQLEFGLDRSGGDILPWHIEHLQFRIQKLIQRRNREKNTETRDGGDEKETMKKEFDKMDLTDVESLLHNCSPLLEGNFELKDYYYYAKVKAHQEIMVLKFFRYYLKSLNDELQSNMLQQNIKLYKSTMIQYLKFPLRLKLTQMAEY